MYSHTPVSLYDFYVIYVTMLRVYIEHFDNTPMQYSAIFCCKNDNFQLKKKQHDIFLIFAQIIDCGYTFEPPY